MTHDKAIYWTAEELALLKDPKLVRGLGRVFECPICASPLERVSEHWACPAGLGHTRLIGDFEMHRRIVEAMEAPDVARTRTSAEAVLRAHVLARLSIWADARRRERERERERDG